MFSVKVKGDLEHTMEAQRGVEVYLYSFFNLGGTVCTGAGWAPCPAWAGAENLALIGVRFPEPCSP